MATTWEYVYAPLRCQQENSRVPNAAGPTVSVRTPILSEYHYLEAEDISEALSYAAWRAKEVEVPLRQP